MKVPGSNLLNKAFRLIAKTSVLYFKDAGRYTNSIGLDVTTRLSPVEYRGSVQPVPRNLYELLGLDFTKSYVNFYVSRDIIGVNRDVSGDQFSYGGRQYQCLSTTPWFGIDGWEAVLAIDVGVADVYVEPDFFGFDEYHLNYDNGGFGPDEITTFGFDDTHVNYDNGNFYAG